MSNSGELLTCVVIESVPADLPLIEELLGVLAIANYASWASEENDYGRCCIYCETAEEASAFQQQVKAVLDDLKDLLHQPVRDVRLEDLAREDWTETWKQFFHTFKASARLVVKPQWETYESLAGEEVIEINPGMSFGTGYHGTTRACLQFLDELNAEFGAMSLLDAGCGSGILALGACRLGYTPVVAFDNDPQAVAVARENLDAAGCSRVILQCHELDSASFNDVFQVVVANILAPVLIQNSWKLISFLGDDKDRSFLVLSGILDAQYPEVQRCFEMAGFNEFRRRCIDGWTSGIYRPQ